LKVLNDFLGNIEKFSKFLGDLWVLQYQLEYLQ